MLKINVRLLWKRDFALMEEVGGIWADTSFLILEDDLIEEAEIDDWDILESRKAGHFGEWREYSSQSQTVNDKIAIYVEDKGNLPTGIPILAELGMPFSIDFLNYEVVEDEEDV